jgi:hypothetical protein
MSESNNALGYLSTDGDDSPAPPPPPPAGQKTLTVVGDSIGAGIGAKLGKYLAPLGYTVHPKAVGGTGPAWNALPDGFDWVGDNGGLLTARLTNPNPNVVVVCFGGRSTIAASGGTLNSRDPEGRWWHRTVKGARRILDECYAAGAREVWWVIYPTMRPGGKINVLGLKLKVAGPAEVAAWTDFRTWCRQNIRRTIPADHVIDLSPRLSPGDVWTKSVEGVVVRAEDRIHLTEAGYDIAAQVIAAKVEAHAL